MAVVEVNRLRKVFGSSVVLADLDIAIKEGEVVALVGRSGSGKSTLLRCIAGLEVFQQGSVRCGDKKLVAGQEADRSYFRGVGVVFQQFNLFPHLTVRGNVDITLRRVYRLPKAEVETRVCAALDLVGLSQKVAEYPSRLSGGQQQRVAIARALALHPQILLLDEVTSALDPELVEEVTGVLRGLADRGHTMLIVTHDISFARSVSDRMVFMHAGRIHEEGTPDTILTRPSTEEFARFLGRHRS